ncbi:DNA polymerase [Candidatus Methylomirabilis lanthanidiphila]|uniref:Type-4 uracil-DNA glycosylase n=1 Tax=Candidatus Methylomirabilis lanthanidiphila TaxID=2211376 RepID=A0A564ZG13_9BACT|nr:DNA polymerase [Candidatus Methylomirabilis lanthanidiphila]
MSETVGVDIEELRELIRQTRAHVRRQQLLGVERLYVAWPEHPGKPPEPSSTLAQVRQTLGECTRCKLHTGRKTIVFGVGNPQAWLVFVGEAPGADEDQQGEPFVGRAGQLLTRILEAMKLTREQVYICNIIKCRPPANRNPEPDEIAACEPFLVAQLQAIKPKLICALGTFAAQALLRTKEPISKLRGRFHDYHGIPVLPTFHPAYLLRNPHEKKTVWEDMKRLMREYEQLSNTEPLASAPEFS